MELPPPTSSSHFGYRAWATRKVKEVIGSWVFRKRSMNECLYNKTSQIPHAKISLFVVPAVDETKGSIDCSQKWVSAPQEKACQISMHMRNLLWMRFPSPFPPGLHTTHCQIAVWAWFSVGCCWDDLESALGFRDTWNERERLRSHGANTHAVLAMRNLLF